MINWKLFLGAVNCHTSKVEVNSVLQLFTMQSPCCRRYKHQLLHRVLSFASTPTRQTFHFAHLSPSFRHA